MYTEGRWHLRGQRLQQVLPELQCHQVGQAMKGGKRKKKRGRSWQVTWREVAGVREGGEERRGEAGWLVRWQVCSSGLPGMVRGSSICLGTAVAQSPETGCLRAHWATELHSLKTCSVSSCIMDLSVLKVYPSKMFKLFKLSNQRLKIPKIFNFQWYHIFLWSVNQLIISSLFPIINS